MLRDSTSGVRQTAVLGVTLVMFTACSSAQHPASTTSASTPPQQSSTPAASSCQELADTPTPVSAQQIWTGRKAVVFTQIDTRPPAASDSEVQLRAPFSPTFKWMSGPAPDEVQVTAALGQLSDGPPTATRDDGVPLRNLLRGVPVDHTRTVLGYAAVAPSRWHVTVSCQDGSTVIGTLTTWAKPDLGVLTCGLQAEANAPPAARLAYRRYC